MKKIAVITSTRAEFGLLSPVISALRGHESENLRVDLVVTGTHLYEQFGMTVNEIRDRDIRIDHEVLIPVDTGSASDISNNQAQTLIRFTKLFESQKYNAIMILGDRYEMLAVAIAASNTHTPIFHLCGGDITEGAIDDCIRHSITKMSYLHFVTNEDSRRRVIQLGEDPERVFNYGSTSIDNILRSADMTKADALKSVGLDDCNYAVCTYHPVTMETGSVETQIASFLDAIRAFPDIAFIITKSNADQGGTRINELLDEAEEEIGNLHVFTSLGVRRYLSLMKYARFVLGNSSSGIIETPAFHIPTVNIGDRQRGRLRSESVIDCGDSTAEIVNAINTALSDEHRAVCSRVVSPYGDGNAAPQIAEKSIETLNSNIDLKKRFYDIQ